MPPDRLFGIVNKTSSDNLLAMILRGVNIPFTDDEYQQAIDKLPDKFTSHEFILMLGRMHQQRYIEFLCDYRDVAHPFQTAHGQLAKRLNDWKKTLEPLGPVVDKDIFGHPRSNMKWRKRP